MVYYLTMKAHAAETFVTRKITRGLANIALGLETCLHMGNIDAFAIGGMQRLCPHAVDDAATE